MNTDLELANIPTFRVDRRAVTIALILAALGLLAVVVAWLLDPTRAALAYLAAFVTCLSTCLGALIFLSIVHAMNAKWPVAIRRLIEALVSALVPLVIAFVPIAVAVELLYPWAQPRDALPHELLVLLDDKRPYLEVEFFWARAALYFVCWLAVALPLQRWSSRQDEVRDPSLRTKQRTLGAASLPLLGLTLTFAAFDWVMSLDPAWYSTIFGVHVFAGGFLAAIGLLTIATTVAHRRGRMHRLVRPSHYYALGRLLLAFTIFWAYIAFFQFMLIWLANKPHEVTWYLVRTEHGWQGVAIAIILLQFALPFAALLSYRIKWHPRALSVVAGIIVFAHWLEIHWMIVPSANVDMLIHWVDVGALLLLGGSCTAFVLWRLGGRAAAPRWDRALPKGASYDRV